MAHPPPHPRALVLWVIWFAMLCSVFLYQLILGKGVPHGSNLQSSSTPPIVWVAIAQVAAASFIRWLLIPRTKEVPKMVVLMIIGLALGEGVEFYGLFLVPHDQPETKLLLWILSILGIAQFAPVYAKRPTEHHDAFHGSSGPF